MIIVLVLFCSLLSYSQNNSIQNDIFFKGFELGNNGSIFIPYFPNFPSPDLNIKSFDMGLRLIDNFENKEKLDKIYKLPDLVINNEVYYQGSSREGAYVKANLSRPISNNSFLDFNYNNLISKGFYPFQENKYSNLTVEYSYFNKNKDYAFSIFLNTINGFYNEIGGVVDYNLQSKMIAVEPAESPVMSGGEKGLHGIQGIGDGSKFLVDLDKVDEIITISTEEAKERALRLAKENGLFVGISAGANVLASERWIEQNKPDGVVVTILCDRGERYFSLLEDKWKKIGLRI